MTMIITDGVRHKRPSRDYVVEYENTGSTFNILC